MNKQRWSRELKMKFKAWTRMVVANPKKVIVFGWLLTLLIAVTIIPMVVVKRQPDVSIVDMEKQLGRQDLRVIERAEEIPLKVKIYLTKEKRIVEVPLEQYIRGVLAAEMPIEFELEALKAQAIAARTYIVRRYAEKDFSQVPVEGAWVTDTVTHQAYITTDQIEKKWKNDPNRTANLKKLNQAVVETEGLVITYSGYPILASFFSTSNGYTENSEDYWTSALPYLRSVESPWEENLSPKFMSTIVLTVGELMRKLHIDAVPVSGKLAMKVIERSDGHRIKQIQIGDKVLSGREVRELLGLSSTQFTWRSTGNKVEFTSYGSGHGVGMSQWGAQGMAMEGRKALDIISYYYTGVRIQKIDSLQSIL